MSDAEKEENAADSRSFLRCDRAREFRRSPVMLPMQQRRPYPAARASWGPFGVRLIVARAERRKQAFDYDPFPY